MANSTAPDPRDFESWEDAFQHPIPAVRGMEKKLRNGALENQEKLKTLVGASYRDLLGTARTIIDADKQMHEVERLLVDVGRRCDSRILDKIAANHSRLEAYNASHQGGQYSMASQLFVLQKCLAVIGRLLRTKGSTLLTAKLLVVSRLLHKTLSSLTDAPVASDTLGSRLVSLRQRLLRHIDRRFEHSYTEIPALVEDMTAFSLATSSSPSDVLRHFQHLRLEVIKRPLQEERESVKASIINRLQTYLDTQRETRAIYPDLLQASLKTLSARALLEDPNVLAIDELGLDNHLRWIPNEVKHFTPWTRHDELQKSKANQSFTVWAKDGLKGLMQRLSDDIGHESDMELLAGMRAELLQMWLSNRQHAPGIPSREVLREMRSQFVTRLKTLIEGSFRSLYTEITQSTSRTLQNWDQASLSTGTLWDATTLSMDIGGGALSFRSAVINQRSGRYESINQVLDVYETRCKDSETIQAVIKQMRELRWDDDQDFSDSDSEEDVEQSSSTYHLLSRDDPGQLQSALRDNAVSFGHNLERFFNTEIAAGHVDCSSATAPGLFTLRLIREVRRRVPLLLQNIDKEAAQQLICPDLVAKLHRSLAENIKPRASTAFVAALDQYIHSRRNPQSLWEGVSPPLPVQITPATFKTLRATVKDMEALGPDVWTSGAVVVLRSALDEAFGTALADSIAKLEGVANAPTPQPVPSPPNTNGVAAADSPDHAQDQADNEAPVATQDPPTDAQPASPTNSPKQPSKTDPSPAADPAEDDNDDAANASAKHHRTLTKAKATQLLFDALYLSHALGLAPPTASSSDMPPRGAKLADAAAALARTAGLDGAGGEAAAMARLGKAAGEYRRRTYLLFGLLSCP